ncbi:amidohydrolase family protein [Nocardia sp. NBC_00508]|uniref:amidohydrolase family protein n=1 Tax=Nocardia sp. NBC_00508 TaxID=2975992 RepID=UPI002E80EF38|nr:amidohydrolase family protein [Nocardia sp. NBC_00508]WUD65060.1 amidohydrolase family protein [Nocardia sp. NBC_00508]
MTIDVWAQHPTQRFLAHDMFASLRRWTGATIPTGDIPLMVTLDAMDAAGVDQALISAWHAPDGILISNDEVAAWAAEAPERLFPVASVDLRRPMDAVRELRRRAGQGFKGLRVLPWLWELPPTDRRFYPLFAACVDLGLPFCTQVGHTGPLRPSETGRPIPYIDQVALDFPELTIVCGHIGYPWTEEMIAVARKHENVVIDTSAYTTKRLPAELVSYLESGSGRRKVLFGTNYPMIFPQHALDGLDALGLDDETRELYLDGNARRVFGLTG